MKVALTQVKKMFTEILNNSGANDHDQNVMLDLFIDQIYSQNRFSPFTKSELDSTLKQLNNSINLKHELVIDKPAYKLINGNGKSAILIGVEMVEMVCQMAKSQGIGAIGLYNSTYHNPMGFYSRLVAQKDLIAIVTANGGPASVAPFNGSQPLFGTNPLSYGIPTENEPIVFDGATGQYAYGTIRLAKKSGQKLAPDTYFDKDGKFTTDPATAIGLIPFGGYKGYAINLLIEVLTGALVHAKMGLSTQTEKDLGSLFIAIDPSLTTTLAQFKKETTQLVKEIMTNTPLPGKTIRVPGWKQYIKKQALATDQIEVSEDLWQEFNTFYQETVKS